ncbi:MAG: carbohydrate kinase family protein [Firmicutes bacterium]|nr:carbohydrate kinase family protein [Bacillota bacterium]
MNVLVIGAQNIDIFARSHKTYTLHDSNIAKIHIAFGGVGRNIAENLRRLGNSVSFLTVFGDDYFSQSAHSSLLDMGMDISESLHLKNASNSVYLGVMDKGNDLFVGLNDMDIVHQLNKAFFISKHEYINRFSTIVIDNNLPQESIDYLLTTYHDKEIVMDGVSTKKVIKIKHHLDKISVLKLNHLELEKLAKDGSIDEKIQYLKNQGANTLLITNQDQDVMLVKGEEVHTITPYKVRKIVNASGAGDSFLSGFVHGMINGYSETDCLDCATKVAYLTLLSRNSTNELLNIEEVNKVVR